MDGGKHRHAEMSADELRKKNAELEELNRFKSGLLSFAAHQMKAPLGIVKGYTTLFREGQYGAVSEKQKEVLKKMEFTVDELVDLLANVIDLKKIEEGKMEYEFSRTDLVGLVKDVVERFAVLMVGKKIEIAFGASARDVFVQADPRELKHVVQNLIDNAVKYTQEGSIRVEVKVRGGEAVCSVADSGRGIAPEALPTLFQEFSRGNYEGAAKGSGIGLHIGKSIIDAHGGKIWCESEGEGKGSTFSFSLRKA